MVKVRTRYLNRDRFEEHPAFLYSVNQGKLVCRPGVISFDKEKKLGAVFYVEPSTSITSISVDENEGTIWNRLIWFYEKSDNKAREIFIAYEQVCIKELELKIKKHEKILQSLED